MRRMSGVWVEHTGPLQTVLADGLQWFLKPSVVAQQMALQVVAVTAVLKTRLGAMLSRVAVSSSSHSLV